MSSSRLEVRAAVLASGPRHLGLNHSRFVPVSGGHNLRCTKHVRREAEGWHIKLVANSEVETFQRVQELIELQETAPFNSIAAWLSVSFLSSIICSTELASALPAGGFSA